MDYGVGNIHSVRRAFERAGAPLKVSRKPTASGIARAEFLVLPGVGSFSAGARGIAPVRKAVREALEEGKPCLGICLGMQLFFERSEEGPGRGLGFLAGSNVALAHPKLPQVGWNEVEVKDDPLWEGLPDTFHAYYVNSFAPKPAEPGAAIAHTRYGNRFPAAVRRLNTYGVQFHPEKSSRPGLRLVQNFVALAEASA